MRSFEDIFKNADFEQKGDRYTFNKEFLPVRIGENDEPVLGFDTVLEHVNRRGYEVEVDPNGFAKDIKATKNGKTINYAQYKNGNVELEFSMSEEDIDRPEDYVGEVMDDIVGELVRREQKTMLAATNYAQNVLPDIADDQGITEQEALLQQLDFNGDTKTEIIENYLTGDPRGTKLGGQYAAMFEIMPGDDKETNRKQMKGRMPLTDTINNQRLKSRHNNYMTKYLRRVVAETLTEHGRNEELEEKWLEMV